ncbi:hypothetical protein B296_00050093 [Ensete ventricosum]|uniref:NAD(P)H dehydrogenase (quinone) n=1 Tax=Ensete ventricosum TaxID=4639 RepID=A0A426YMT8_ENSVE|nr:hypothetical protein B296_00050093 [Ensete ventricosum]
MVVGASSSRSVHSTQRGPTNTVSYRMTLAPCILERLGVVLHRPVQAQTAGARFSTLYEVEDEEVASVAGGGTAAPATEPLPFPDAVAILLQISGPAEEPKKKRSLFCLLPLPLPRVLSPASSDSATDGSQDLRRVSVRAHDALPSFAYLIDPSYVPETLPEEVLGKMGAPPKSDVPIITPDDLAEADGILFGFPTRFGMMAAQFKAFLDATGGLWRTQALAGKPAGIFYSTGSQGGGQETTP